MITWDMITLFVNPFVGFGYLASGALQLYFAFTHLLWFDIILWLPYYSIDLGVLFELFMAAVTFFGAAYNGENALMFAINTMMPFINAVMALAG